MCSVCVHSLMFPAAIVSMPKFSAYSTSKHALHGKGNMMLHWLNLWSEKLFAQVPSSRWRPRERNASAIILQVSSSAYTRSSSSPAPLSPSPSCLSLTSSPTRYEPTEDRLTSYNIYTVIRKLPLMHRLWRVLSQLEQVEESRQRYDPGSTVGAS